MRRDGEFRLSKLLQETDFVRAVRSDIAWMEEHSTRMDEAGRLKHAFFPYTYALLMRLLCILY